MNVELSELRAFVVVAELRSFNDAAALLNLSQPALSRRVQKLEEAGIPAQQRLEQLYREEHSTRVGETNMLHPYYYLSAGQPHGPAGHNVARVALLRAGLPVSTAGATVNRYCNSGLQAIVQGIARALAQDTQGLLTPEDWLAVATAVAAEAMAHPQRLFNGASPSGGVGVGLISDLLAVAQAAGGRAQGSVLFGPTLREAIIVAMRTVAGNSAAAATNQAKLKELASMLTNRASSPAGQLGSKEWLESYRVLLTRVLHGGTLGDAEITQILQGGRA